MEDVGYEARLSGQLSLNKQKGEGGPGEGNGRSQECGGWAVSSTSEDFEWKEQVKAGIHTLPHLLLHKVIRKGLEIEVTEN